MMRLYGFMADLVLFLFRFFHSSPPDSLKSKPFLIFVAIIALCTLAFSCVYLIIAPPSPPCTVTFLDSDNNPLRNLKIDAGLLGIRFTDKDGIIIIDNSWQNTQVSVFDEITGEFIARATIQMIDSRQIIRL